MMSGDLFQESLIGNTALSEDALKPERYIASNRFKVRKNAGPKFEKRWADRKSRLADLEGFRFFTLLKKVEEDGSECTSTDLGNYISFTVWGNKDNFNTWRSGDAFKEAHGGGGLTGFIGLLSTALFILDGGPKPAFYDALLPIVSDGSVLSHLKSENGWRKVEADGVTPLNPEIFLVQNSFKVIEGKERSFEQQWANKESTLLQFPGFVGFYLQRRDATKADDGFNFMSSAFWKDKASYLNWKASTSGSIDTMASNLSGQPGMAYYEGKLTLLSPLGG
jgi:heme-degrading monooxygenase HmoA